MIHYHGMPITPETAAAVVAQAGHCFPSWNENGETHKRGYYESTWGAINRALRTVGVVPRNPPTQPESKP